MQASRKSLSLAVLAAALMINAPAVPGEEESAPGDPVDCINIARIRSTEVISEKYILFRTRGGTDYVNVLPRNCRSLARNKAFMYKTSIHKLCDLDTITVLNNFSFGFSHGPRCGLGKFSPISEEGIDNLKLEARQGGRIKKKKDQDESVD